MSRHERRLRRLATLYVPLVTAGAWASLRYGVGAHPGGDPAGDLVFKGTALAPPLFLPGALVAGAVLSRRRGAAGVAATTVAGLVGVGFTLGTTVNLRNDLAAARAAAAPVPLTVGVAAFHWVYGPAVAVTAVRALQARWRPPATGSSAPPSCSGAASR